MEINGGCVITYVAERLIVWGGGGGCRERDRRGRWRKPRVGGQRFLRGKTFNRRPFARARAQTTSLASLINVRCRYTTDGVD